MFTTLYISKFGTTCDPKDACLKRTIIFRTKWGNLFLHKFLRSDEEAFHSHPFSFISVMLTGSYIEQIYSPKGTINISRKAFSILFRDAFSFHKIKLTNSQPLTLCLTLPAGKNWHYMDTKTEKTIPWRKYLKKGYKKEIL